ncbi:hypothetical protein ABW20_dc0110135 [Dactylellina cionopaga]|nr:hypothetical protein ABW20_dc0110135 [Dactylellina cionopaga]
MASADAALYTFTVPLFRRGMKTLKNILEKGEAYAKEKGIPTSEMIKWKLSDDMLPLTFQVLTCSNTSKMTCVRVAKAELPTMEDNETTLEELYKRIETTLELLDTVEAKHKAGFENMEAEEVIMKGRNGDRVFTGMSYVQTFAIPNFYFHLVTAYDIMRNHGVPLGKMDYLGGN